MDEKRTGELAGKIWHFINKNGECDSVKIKFDLNINNTELFVALGWLLRENKIYIKQDKNTYWIKLTDNVNE